MKRLMTGMGLILVVLLILCLGYRTAVGAGPRAYLQDRYKTVKITEWNMFSFRCTFGKHRLDYSFVATDHTGRQVHGYICYTTGGWPQPKIHEQRN